MPFNVEPYKRRVHFYETDAVGVVHHSNYIRWMEEARIDFMRRAGLPYSDLERAGILTVVTDAACRFVSSVRFDEEFEVTTRLVDFNGVKAVYEYVIRSVTCGVTAAEGTSGHCFVDAATRRPVRLKKRCPAFYEKALSLLDGPAAGRAGSGSPI